MVNTFKTQFSNMPEELKEHKAKQCLAFAIKMHLTMLSQMSREELDELSKGVEV